MKYKLKFRGSDACRRSAGRALRVFGGLCAKTGKPFQNSPYLPAQAPENRKTSDIKSLSEKQMKVLAFPALVYLDAGHRGRQNRKP